jgi:hypothetical protein
MRFFFRGACKVSERRSDPHATLFVSFFFFAISRASMEQFACHFLHPCVPSCTFLWLPPCLPLCVCVSFSRLPALAVWLAQRAVCPRAKPPCSRQHAQRGKSKRATQLKHVRNKHTTLSSPTAADARTASGGTNPHCPPSLQASESAVILLGHSDSESESRIIVAHVGCQRETEGRGRNWPLDSYPSILPVGSSSRRVGRSTGSGSD